ncbi:MAG: Rid family detoxifying hydrolase [Anaerolineales bacterium]
MTRQVIQTNDAPQAIGPYSQGVLAEGRFVFVSGQIGLDPQTMQLVEGGLEAQTRQVLSNLRAVLAAAGATPADVVKTTVFLQSIDDYKAVNALYAEVFQHDPPARAAFGGLQLPAGALVEIECIARVST